MTVSHSGLDAAVRQTATSFARPHGWQGALQLITSFGAFLAGGRLVRFRDAV